MARTREQLLEEIGELKQQIQVLGSTIIDLENKLKRSENLKDSATTSLSAAHRTIDEQEEKIEKFTKALTGAHLFIKALDIDIN